MARKKKAEQLALDAWMDEDWYLEETYFEGKSDAESASLFPLY